MDVGNKPQETPVLAPRVVKAAPKCPICGSPSSTNDTDGLCWICRRLKTSAWKDSDHQMPVQE